MQYILVPVKHPSKSQNTLKNAFVMAERLKMGVIVYHTMPLPTGFTHGSPLGGVYGSLEQRKKQVREELDRMIEQVPNSADIAFETMISYGNISYGIKQIESQNDIGLILMVSEGANGIMKSLWGTHASDVVKSVDSPVIILPPNTDISKMKTIALAGDYAEVTDPAVFEKLIEINSAFFAHMEIIHIHGDDFLEDDEIEVARGLERYFKNVPHTFHFYQYNNVKEGLLAFCHENEVDLLAMIPRQHSLLERLTQHSQTKKMIHDIPVPILVLQD
ncbi:MAG: hypothetical protein Roseis2KO_02350 [Roseivirga sp.]